MYFYIFCKKTTVLILVLFFCCLYQHYLIFIGYQFIKEHLSSNLLLVCHSLHILATTQIESGLLKDAYNKLEELSKNPIIVYNKKERSRFYFAFATYFIKCAQYQVALSHFKKAEELAFQNNDIALLKRIYKYYASIYAQLNNYKNAYIQTGTGAC